MIVTQLRTCVYTCAVGDQHVCPVAIVAVPIHHIHLRPRQGANWSFPAVTNGSVGVTCVESFKLLVHFEHILHNTQHSTTNGISIHSRTSTSTARRQWCYNLLSLHLEVSRTSFLSRAASLPIFFSPKYARVSLICPNNVKKAKLK